MSNSSSLDLYRTRSATDVINLTFRFLRDQFGPLLKGLLLLAGPPLIFANILGSHIGMTAQSPTGGAPTLILLQFVCAIIGGIIVAAVSIGSVEAYHRDGRDGLTLRRLWDLVRTHGLALFGRQLQAGLIMVLGALVVAAIGAGIGAAVGQLGSSSLLSVAVGGLFGLLMLVWFLYAYPRFAMLLPGQVDPERSISLRRCVHLVEGRWGQTLGVLLLALVISLIIFSVGWISQFIVGILQGVGVTSTGTIGVVLAGFVAGVANIFSSTITYTALTFQYYNLVEQAEQVRLSEEVERLEQEKEASSPPASGEDPPSSDPDDPSRWRGDASDSTTN